jgi:hypothetical protein
VETLFDCSHVGIVFVASMLACVNGLIASLSISCITTQNLVSHFFDG